MLNRQCYFNLVTILQQIFWCYVFLFQNECAKPQVCVSVSLPNNCQIIKYQLPYSRSSRVLVIHSWVLFSLPVFILESWRHTRFMYSISLGWFMFIIDDDGGSSKSRNRKTRRDIVSVTRIAIYQWQIVKWQLYQKRG
jgi:hypothetical protein